MTVYNQEQIPFTGAFPISTIARNRKSSFKPNTLSPQYSGLVGWWSFAFPGSRKLYDVVGGRHGVPTGMPTIKWVFDSDKNNWTIDFDGVNDAYQTPYSRQLHESDNITVSFWIKPKTMTQGDVIVSRWNATGNVRSWAVSFGAGSTLRFDTSSNGTFNTFNTTNGTTPLVAGEWYHVAVVHDSVTRKSKIYLNGKLDGQITPNSSGLKKVFFGIRIGASVNFTGTSSWYEGRFDDLRIYDKPLSDSEISHIYNPQTRYDLWIDHSTSTIAFFEKAFVKLAGSARVTFRDIFVPSGGLVVGSSAPIGGVRPGGTATVSILAHVPVTYNEYVSFVYGATPVNVPRLGSSKKFSNKPNTLSPQYSELISWWSFAFPGSKKLYDVVGGTHGVPAGMPIIKWVFDSDINSWAIDFDGVNDAYQTPYNRQFNEANNVTISFWIKPKTMTQGDIIVSRWNAAGNVRSWAVSFGSGSKLRFDTSSSGTFNTSNTVVGTTPLVAGEWHHVTVVHDSILRKNRIYLNGKLDGQITPNSSGLKKVFFGIRIGHCVNFGGPSSWYEGRFSDLRIYGKPLYDSEISHIYNPQTRCDLWKEPESNVIVLYEKAPLKIAGNSRVTFVKYGSRQIPYDSSGEIKIGGNSVSNILKYILSAKPGIISLTSLYEYNFRFNKTVDFSWNTSYRIRKSANIRWNVGQLGIYWYRIVSKGIEDPCLPQEECCQKFIVNIHARTLPELCEKLSKRKFKFPIDTVQRFRRPAENAVLANTQEDFDCNPLELIDVCSIPQCADFCVDRDLLEVIGFKMKVQLNAFREYSGTGGAFFNSMSIYSYHKNTLDFTHDSVGFFSISGNASSKTNSYRSYGGVSSSGFAKIAFSRWDFIGGNQSETTGVAYPNEVETYFDDKDQEQWALAERVVKNDSLFSQVDVSYSKSSDVLVVRGFNIDLPPWAEILSLKVRVDRVSTQVSVRDKKVYLLSGDKIISDNMAVIGTDWPLIQTIKTYGLNGWRDPDFYSENFTPEEISNENFGVAIQVKSVASYPTTIAKINYISLEILYQDPNGSIIRLESSSGETAKSPSYHTSSNGRLILHGDNKVRVFNRFVWNGTGRGLRAGGHATSDPTFAYPLGGAKSGGVALVTPYLDVPLGGSKLGGIALIKPFYNVPSGGIKLGGKGKLTGSWIFKSTGDLEISGDADSIIKTKIHFGTGSVTINGSAKIKKPVWHWASNDNIIYFAGDYQFTPGNVNLPNLSIGYDMFVIQTVVNFSKDVHVGNAVGINKVLNKCGCYSIPMMVNMSHNIARNNKLTEFLNRNNIGFSNNIKLRYNETDDSWQSNFHLKGRSFESNNIENWDFVFNLKCSDSFGSLNLGTPLWQTSIQIFRRIIDTGEDFDTRIIVSILPDNICGSIINTLDFDVTYNTQSDLAIINPNSTIYHSLIFDNIGLFKNKSWMDSPDLNLKISQVSISKSQVRVNLTDSVLG